MDKLIKLISRWISVDRVQRDLLPSNNEFVGFDLPWENKCLICLCDYGTAGAEFERFVFTPLKI